MQLQKTCSHISQNSDINSHKQTVIAHPCTKTCVKAEIYTIYDTLNDIVYYGFQLLVTKYCNRARTEKES